MSLYDYQESLELSKSDPSFYSLIMAAARKADTDNLRKLESVFPETVNELRRRYHAPGGQLPEDDIPPNITIEVVDPNHFGVIRGIAATRQVFINGTELTPDRSQNIRNHSPDGFEWGYGGSGPTQLALAICLELTDEKTALKMYQAFKFKFITALEKGQDFELNLKDAQHFFGTGR